MTFQRVFYNVYHPRSTIATPAITSQRDATTGCAPTATSPVGS